MRVARAETAVSADIAHALLKGRESAVRGAAHCGQVGAPRIVLGVGVRADLRDAGENREHEEESLHRRALPYSSLIQA